VILPQLGKRCYLIRAREFEILIEIMDGAEKRAKTYYNQQV
jgi:hypothetical protein